MEPTIIYNIQAGPYWDWKVALDLFFGGAGVGAFLFSVALLEFWGHRYRRVPQTAAFLAPVLVVMGLIFLLLKLGQPLQLIYTFTHFAPTSPLWWGGIFQTLFVVGSIWYAIMWRTSDLDLSGSRRVLGLVLAPLALIVGAYHGFLLAVIVARPLWNTGPTVVAALLAFATTGIAAVMLTHLIRMRLAGRLSDLEHVGHFLDDLRPVRHALAAMLILQLGTFLLWWVSLRFGSLSDRIALDAANLSLGPSFWGLGIGVGLILPLFLGGGLVLIGESANRTVQVMVIGLTSGLILLGGIFFRFGIVLGGQIQLPPLNLS